MQLKFFSIPIIADESCAENVNKFLRSVRVLEIKRELVSVENGAYWAICVTYLPVNMVECQPLNATKKVDYREVLTAEVFEKFSQLRKIRKRLADADAVPAYAVFTDYELSEIAQADKIDASTIKQIKGIGAKKLEKYGNKLCELFVADYCGEEGRKSD